MPRRPIHRDEAAVGSLVKRQSRFPRGDCHFAAPVFVVVHRKPCNPYNRCPARELLWVSRIPQDRSWDLYWYAGIGSVVALAVGGRRPSRLRTQRARIDPLHSRRSGRDALPSPKFEWNVKLQPMAAAKQFPAGTAESRGSVGD